MLVQPTFERLDRASRLPRQGRASLRRPVLGSRLHGLPPALVITTPDDPMRNECLACARRPMQAGVAIHVRAIAAHDWPDALAGPVPPGPLPAWAGAVRKNFADFFPAVMPSIPARPTDGSVA